MSDSYNPPTPPAPPAPQLPTPRQVPDGTALRADSNIQGNVLAAFNKDHQAFLLLRFTDGASGRAWLTALLPQLSTNAQVAAFNAAFSGKRRASGADPADMHATWVNVSVTGSGLGVLSSDAVSQLTGLTGLDPTVATWLAGASAAAPAVGDSGSSDPSQWLFGTDPTSVHAIVAVAADRGVDLGVALAGQRELAASHNVSIVFEQDGQTLPGPARGHEHFGFKDGISQPGVRGFDPPDPASPNQVDGKPGADLIATGEFILGYVGQDSPGQAVPAWMWDGSLLVFRRLAQNVSGFWSDVQTAFETLPDTAHSGTTGIATEETLSARLVGRWRDGTPTDDSPNNDVPAPADPGLNDFDFSSDSDGQKTPHAAHIRKVYPRAGATAIITEADAEKHRILRRGIPFGPTFDPSAGEGHGVDAQRGLVFQCYQASLNDQFIFIQQNWVNSTDFSAPGDGKDAVIGQETDIALRPNGQQDIVHVHQWVTTQGMIFGLTPSIPTLQLLANGSALPIAGP